MIAVNKTKSYLTPTTNPRCLGILIFVLSVHVVFIESATADAEQPIWKLAPEVIRDRVNRGVRAGSSLKPAAWPNGAKVAVSISFDLDVEALWLGFYKQSSAAYLSRGEYGARVGMPRILALLDEHEIPATFFVPVMSMVLHPDTLQQILTRTRHELGFHSYVHESVIEFKGMEERETYENALAKFTELTGKRPVGFRSGAWDLSPQTLDIEEKFGHLTDEDRVAIVEVIRDTKTGLPDYWTSQTAP